VHRRGTPGRSATSTGSGTSPSRPRGPTTTTASRTRWSA
jgi:hypothetical protein